MPGEQPSEEELSRGLVLHLNPDGLYDIGDPDAATGYLDKLVDDMADESMPDEVRSLAGTLRRWRDKILA